MDEKLIPIVAAIKERFNAQDSEFRDEVTVIVTPEQIVEVCTALRDEFSFEMFLDETAVDYWPQETPRFHVVYHLYSISQNIVISLRVPLDGNAPHLPTVEGVYPNANWYERELFDLMGITYDGHSDMRRILMPQDWQGHPLRKDYPLSYEEVRFSFNKDNVDLRKPYSKE